VDAKACQYGDNPPPECEREANQPQFE
jgi:hypothetical protein